LLEGSLSPNLNKSLDLLIVSYITLVYFLAAREILLLMFKSSQQPLNVSLALLLHAADLTLSALPKHQ